MTTLTNSRADPPRQRAWWQDAVVYRRTDLDGDLLNALNFAAEARRLPRAFGDVPLLSSDPRRAAGAAGSELRLAPYEGLVLTAR